MKTTKSDFNSSHVIVKLDTSDEKYSIVKPYFDKHGLAFKRDNVIFFDMPRLKSQGYDDKVHLTFIEAHEIAHSVLKHTKSSRKVEAEADFLAILLCQDSNFVRSANLGKKYFNKRNGISFSKYEKIHGEDVLSRLTN